MTQVQKVGSAYRLFWWTFHQPMKIMSLPCWVHWKLQPTINVDSNVQAFHIPTDFHLLFLLIIDRNVLNIQLWLASCLFFNFVSFYFKYFKMPTYLQLLCLPNECAFHHCAITTFLCLLLACNVFPTLLISPEKWKKVLVTQSSWWPTGLLYPWNSLGKNTGVRCHFLL